MKVKELAACVAILVCVAAPAWGAVWDGSDGLLWSNGNNWTPDGVPDGEDAIINNGLLGSPTLNASVAGIVNLEVSGYSTLNINTGADLTASGSGTVAVGGASDEGYVEHTSGAVSFGTDLTLGGAATDFGRWSMWSDGTLGVTGDLTVGGSGNGQFDLQGTSILTVGGSIDIAASGGSGSMTVGGGTLGQLAGGGDPDILADLVVNNGASLAVQGSTPTINVASYTQTSGASLGVVLDDFGVATINASGNMTLGGALNVTIAGGASPAPAVYDIIDAAGTRTGFFSSKSLPDGVKLRYEAATVKLYVGVEPPEAPTAYPGEYLVISTDTADGGAVYKVSGGTLTFVSNLPNPANASKIGYYHNVDGGLYFSQDQNSGGHWSVVLEDVLDPGITASSTKIWNSSPPPGDENSRYISRMVQGPDGEIYTHVRYGELYQYDPTTDTPTSMGAHTDLHLHHHEMAAYGDSIYAPVKYATVPDGLYVWTLSAGTWSGPTDTGVTGLGDHRGNLAIRQSDGMAFAGDGATVKYVDVDLGGAAGTMPAVGSGSMNWGGMAIAADGTKLWITGNNGGQFLGYFDITGDLATAPWVEVVAPGAGLTGLSGADSWGLTYIDTRTDEEPPVPGVPEPAGLGLVGLALLAVRRKRS